MSLTSLLKTAVPMLLVVIHNVHGWKTIEPLNEWKATFNSSSFKSLLIPWKDTYIRLALADCRTRDNYSLYIDTVDPSYSHPVQCAIPTSSKSDNIYSSASLGNGKVVLQLSNGFVIVDLAPCTMVNFISEGSFSISPDFDTFHISSYADECNGMCVFKYNDRGERIGEIKALRQVSNIKKIENSSNNSRVYYAVHNTDSLHPRHRKSKIFFLNSDFDIVESHGFNHLTEAYSFEHGKVTVCYQIPDEITCKLMDSKFNVTAIASFEIPKSIDQEGNIAVHNLVSGGAVVFHEKRNWYDDGVMLYRHIDADGKSKEKDGFLFIRKEGNYAEDFKIYSYEKDAIQGIYCGMMFKNTYLIGKCIKAQ